MMKPRLPLNKFVWRLKGVFKSMGLCVLLVLMGIPEIQAQARFQQEPDPKFYPERSVVESIIATIPYQGYDESQAYFGQGEYEVFLDGVDGVLDRPIIVTDGFDPGDTRGIGALYASLSFGGQNLADELRALGYDIIILNAPLYTTGGKDIDGGGDYIQRNAMVLVALIDYINAEKVGNEELVVLGPSMGGLIGRYALAYMEQQGLSHETRLYISFDSPHKGANIPISLQYLINYFAQEFGDPGALATVEFVLKSPAAKQMLVDHFTGHLAAGSELEQDPNLLAPAGAPGFRAEFQEELDALGFPAEVRNVTMINGALNGEGPGSPGIEVIDATLEIDALTDISIALHFAPLANQTIDVTDVTTYFIGIPLGNYLARARSLADTDGVDSAPGGTATISSVLAGGGGNPVLEAFIDALQQDTYCFIPTISALAIDTPNWYEIPNLNDSPFVNISAETNNSAHVSISQVSAQFAIDEIVGMLGSPDESAPATWVRVLNPAQEGVELAIAPSAQSEPIQATLYHMNGAILGHHQWAQGQSRVSWPGSWPPGVYLLSLTSGRQTAHLRLIIR